MSVKITREEYRRIKQMNREEMERFISRCLRTEPEEKEQIRKEALFGRQDCPGKSNQYKRNRKYQEGRDKGEI